MTSRRTFLRGLGVTTGTLAIGGVGLAAMTGSAAATAGVESFRVRGDRIETENGDVENVYIDVWGEVTFDGIDKDKPEDKHGRIELFARHPDAADDRPFDDESQRILDLSLDGMGDFGTRSYAGSAEFDARSIDVSQSAGFSDRSLNVDPDGATEETDIEFLLRYSLWWRGDNKTVVKEVMTTATVEVTNEAATSGVDANGRLTVTGMEEQSTDRANSPNQQPE